MARFDKVDSTIGGFRARLAADAPTAVFGLVRGVGLDAQGRLTAPGVPGQSGFKGVVIVDRTQFRAGTPIDVMTNGEILEVAGLNPGTEYYLVTAAGATQGTLTATATGNVYVGHTVEADRLVVRFGQKLTG